MHKLMCLLIGICMLGGCNGTQESESTGPDMSLHFGVMMVLDSFPIFIAEDLGYFDDEGLTVTIDRFMSGMDRDVAFQANDNMDGLTLDMVGLAMFQEGGIDKVMLASTIGLAAVMGAPEATSMDDLVGGTVLAARNSAMDYLLYTALAQAGIPESDVDFVEIPAVPVRMEMLLNGQGVGALLPEPFKSLAEQQGLNVIADTRGLGTNPFGMTVRRSTAMEKREALQAFVRALDRAVEYINAAPREEVMGLLIEMAGFPEPLRETFDVPVFPRFRSPTVAQLDHVFEFARHRGILSIPLSGEDVLVDLGF